MKRRDPRDFRDLGMRDDPNESPLVRELLNAGRAQRVQYDVESGLARHLANLQANAPVPTWAVQAAVQKTTSTLWAWLLPPVIGMAALGGWIYARYTEPESGVTLTPVQVARVEARPVPSVTAAPATPVVHAPAPAIEPSQAAVPEEVAGVRGLGDQPRHAGRHAAPLPRRGKLSGRHERLELRRTGGSSGEGEALAALSPTANEAPVELSGTSFDVPVVSAHTAPTSVETSASSAARTSAAQTQEAQAKDSQQQVARASEPKPAAREGVAARPVPESDARLEREMQMLAVAQRVLRDDPERTLRLTRQGEREFHASMFSAERKQVSLLALVQLGRVDEARRLGVPFLRAYPNAPWSARLREALASGRLPAP